MTNYKGDNKTELPLGKLNLMSNVPYILLESIFFNFINSSLFYLFFFSVKTGPCRSSKFNKFDLKIKNKSTDFNI